LQATPNKPSLGRTLLVLGRVSNLPTVWSNCIAGWWLGGGGEVQPLVLLCAGAGLLYTGGMYLNDACDSRFDALHRSGRPIPSGAIQRRTVWILSCVLLGIGALLLALLGKTTALIALGLLGCIIFYDAVHKKTILSPVVMAGCRFLLYLVAASTASAGINNATLWSAVALAAYVIGLSYLARKESSHARINPWSLLFLLTPVLIACLLDDINQNFKVVVLSVIFLAWIVWCLRPLLARKAGAIGQTVSGLLAGIVCLDLLAVHGIPGLMPLVFVFLFGSALLLQRTIPAT
jgi:4-hydroxybenzoate polyprenyltransferase